MAVEVIVGIIVRDGKVLVAERPQGKPYALYWEFPGGKIETNETPLAALHRELAEELGIKVTAAVPWFEYIHHYPDKSVLLKLWIVEQFTGEPRGLENQQIRWVDEEELLRLGLLDGNGPIIDRLPNLLLTQRTGNN